MKKSFLNLKSRPYVIALSILAIIVAMLLIRYGESAKFDIKSPLGSVTAEGKNAAPSAVVAPGVKTGVIKSGGEVLAESSSTGGIVTGDIDAKSSVTVKHVPDMQPPKK